MIHSQRFLFCAHSGFAGTPDNSLNSLYAGAEAGYPLAEVDVRVTGDGQLVLHHDETLADSALRIADHTLETLREIAPHLVSLADALRVAKKLGLGMNLDVKTWMAAAPAAALCRELGMAEHCHFSGLEPETAKRVADMNLPVRHMLNVGRDLALMPETAVRTALAVRAIGLNCHHQTITTALTRNAHRSLLWVWAWTVNDDARCLELAGMGVNGITRRAGASTV